MRKQTKLVAVLSAAALLAIGASMTSMAAQGWQMEGDQWYYYDNNGDYVTDEWRKSGNNWYYLGDDGYMVTNYLLEDGDDTYYLDANGVMVTNSWVAVAPDDDDYEDDAPDHYWYYFQANGRAVKQTGDTVKKRTINGKTYGFDEDGRMLYGFVSEDGEKFTEENPFENAMYYFGDSDDGAMHQGWLQYMDGSDLSGTVGWDQDYDDLNEMWFYFNPSNGKKVEAEDGADEAETKNINGNRYAFDENGVMISEWDLGSGSVASPSSRQRYFNSETDGHLAKSTWVWAVPAEEIDADDYDDDQYRWFYVDGSGKTVKDDLRKIGSRRYLFNEVGIMQSGLFVLDDNENIITSIDEDETDGEDIMNMNLGDDHMYYFGDEETDGSMKTGKAVQVELADDTYTFGFNKSGEGYNGEESNKLYINGLRIDASSDYRYQSVNGEFASVSDGSGNPISSKTLDINTYGAENYVVGTSGTIVDNGRYVKDADDGYYAIADDGLDNEGEVAYFEDDEDARSKARDFADCGFISNNYDEDGDYVSLGSDCE